jgi:hypothetical protein
MSDQLTLVATVEEIEEHVAADGWDQSARLYALVPTAALLAREPKLAAALGLELDPTEDSLTPVEQDTGHAPAGLLEELLAAIVWPAEVVGCVAAVERVVLPPEADADLPEDPAEAAAYAASHPLRQEVRLVAGVTRTGASYCALRMRAHDQAQSVVAGPDLVPGLIELLRTTLEEEHPL